MDANKKTVEGLYIPPKTFSIIENLLDYNAFFRQYLETNTPCLIRAKSIMEKWQSCSDWIDSEKQIPNLDFFKKLLDINEHTVPVSNCGQKYFNSQEKCDMSFESFLKYWNKPREDSELNCFYLKDWHFVKEVPQYKPYQTPEYFSSDWLNEYLENSNQNHSVTQDFKKSDYKFVYIGPKGSWTPFHSDVFGSYSWSANVVGEKEWIFFPPGYEKFLIDSSSREVFYDIYKVLPSDANLSLFDQQSFTYRGQKIIYYIVRQKQNEIIFVPSGWYHQVSNVENTISINHNWFNATNLENIWSSLCNEMKKVESEISDCKAGCKDLNEWNIMCQNLLRHSHGMNVADFIDLCAFIAKRRIESLNFLKNSMVKEGYEFRQNHVIYDLRALKKVLSDIDIGLFLHQNKSKIIEAINNSLEQ